MISPAARLHSAREVAEARALVQASGLLFEEGVDDVVGMHQEGRIVATASRAGFVLKMFAIEPEWQGGSILGDLAAELIRLGRAAGHESFFVFTRPEHALAFEQIGFRLLVTGGTASLLEYGGGFDAYLKAHETRIRPGRNGASVINGNPFTYGHLYLVESSAARVETFYVFVVREDRSVFPFDVRIRLAREATRHLGNVEVLDTSRYAVSAGTFPSYFLKKLDAIAIAQMQIDLRLFASRIAPAFHVRTRFVGHEPFDTTTAAYNRTMREVFPEYGLGLSEIQRLCEPADAVRRLAPDRGGGFISATKVRAALARRDFDALRCMVPGTTLEFLRSEEGERIAERLAGELFPASLRRDTRKESS
jgi:[citrate (pro-3S)-lyase] ligase